MLAFPLPRTGFLGLLRKNGFASALASQKSVVVAEASRLTFFCPETRHRRGMGSVDPRSREKNQRVGVGYIHVEDSREQR